MTAPSAAEPPALAAAPASARAVGWAAAVRAYPVAALTVAGLTAGLILLVFEPGAARMAFAVCAVAGGLPLVFKTLSNMVSGRFYVDTIASVAIVSSVLMGEYLAGALVVLMQSGGEALEDYGLRRANRSLDNLLRRAPSVARIRRGEDYTDVPAAEVAAGDIMLIRPGDIVAADGLVVEGEGEVDEAALTGEPVPLPKLPGDQVFSGTINLAGTLYVRTTSTAAQSKYELIVRMVQRAQGERAPINRLAERYTPPFTLAALLMAGAVYLATGESSRALSVLVVATPCPLIIATPLAVLSAINRAASLNIIVKSGAAIEQAGDVDIVVFDKTGTLTIGTPAISEIRPAPGFTREEILKAAAAVELHSPHVLASAVVHAARESGITVRPADRFEQTPGVGVGGLVDSQRVFVGSAHYLADHGFDIPEAVHVERTLMGESGSTVALIGIGDRAAGMLVFEDRIRAESCRLIDRLNELSISRILMMTGDTPETATSVAYQIGIRDVRSRLLPDEKLSAIRELSNEGTVMMVGDGINDAPAMAAAPVGVAMGGYGAGIATDAADIVITVENVERVADLIEVGRSMLTIAKQGLLFGLSASVMLMVAASFGLFTPAVGALLQEVIDLAAILNALRSR